MDYVEESCSFIRNGRASWRLCPKSHGQRGALPQPHPGVAQPSVKNQKDPSLSYPYQGAGPSAVVTDST